MRNFTTVCLWLALLFAGFWLINAGYAALNLPAGAGSGSLDWSAIHTSWNYLAAAVVLLGVSLITPSVRWRMAAVAAISVHYLWLFQYEAVIYLAVTTPLMWLAIGHEPVPSKLARWRFAAALVLFYLIGPKLYNWAPYLHWMPRCEILFQGIFLRYCYLGYERVKGVIPATGLTDHLAYLVFIPQVHGILNFTPSEMLRTGHSARQLGMVVQSLGLAGVKIISLLTLDYHVLRDFGYHLGGSHLAALDTTGLWIALLANYIAWFLRLSTSFDLMTAVVRLFGIPVENSFRWALLAASPIELWQRWNIYNRKLLLKFFYFPLGGSHHHRYRNVMVTFLGSALLLHSGWFGGPWLHTDRARLFEECLYFLLQGLFVCAALATRKLTERIMTPIPKTPAPYDPFALPSASHPLRRLISGRPAAISLRCAGVIFTQCASAWCHAIILMTGHKIPFDPVVAPSLSDRLVLMAKAIGLAW